MNELSPEHARYIEQLVASGAYDSPQAALDEAVALLIRREQLRADLQAGIDQADRGELIGAEDVFARLERRAREIEAAARKTQ